MRVIPLRGKGEIKRRFRKKKRKRGNDEFRKRWLSSHHLGKNELPRIPIPGNSISNVVLKLALSVWKERRKEEGEKKDEKGKKLESFGRHVPRESR